MNEKKNRNTSSHSNLTFLNIILRLPKKIKMTLFQGYWDQREIKSPTRVSDVLTSGYLRMPLTCFMQKRKMPLAYAAFTTEELTFLQKSHIDLTGHYSRAPTIEEVMYYFYGFHNPKKVVHEGEGSLEVAKGEIKKWLEGQGLSCS
jgi:hypothetical protein